MVRGNKDLRRRPAGRPDAPRRLARGERAPERPVRARASSPIILQDSHGPSPISSSEDHSDHAPVSPVNWVKTRTRNQIVGSSSRRGRGSRSPRRPPSPPESRQDKKRRRSLEVMIRGPPSSSMPPSQHKNVQFAKHVVRIKKTAPAKESTEVKSRSEVWHIVTFPCNYFL